MSCGRLDVTLFSRGKSESGAGYPTGPPRRPPVEGQLDITFA
ncbi:MAG: hypothetical protein JWR85_3547, partial [Marmoricola sp.]|nr:hypothetical protein [Marmoricola sp.]